MNSLTRWATGLAVASALGLSAMTAQAAPEVTLTVHHFLGPNSPTQKELIEPWAKKVQDESQGRIKVEIFPSMSMGGKPPELYNQVRDGAADIVWTVVGYTPGVFPRTEVFELPTVHRGSAKATTLAIQENFALIAEDFSAVKPLLVHVNAGNALQMRAKNVTSLDDLRGTKLRTPSRTGAWLIEAFGAEPVGMPVPELPQALSRGALDGALVPFEVMLPLKLHELTSHSIEGPGGDRFGTSVFLYGMNKKRYDSLPADLQKVIDNNSGAAIASWAGEIWDRIEEPAKAAQRATGSPVNQLTPEAMKAFDAAGEKIVQRWIDESKGKGLDGQALVDAARASIKKFSSN